MIHEAAPSATAWYFHDSPARLDDPNSPIPTATSSQQSAPPDKIKHDVDPVFAVTSSMLGSLAPSATWQAFSPADVYNMDKAVKEYNLRAKDLVESNIIQNDNIEDSRQETSRFQGKVSVGLDRLYEVNFGTMKLDPIYWPRLRLSSNVHRSTWFFTSTLGPIHPQWEEALESAFQEIKPYADTYLAELEAAKEVPEAIDRLCLPIKLKQGGHEYKCRVVFSVCLTESAAEEDEVRRASTSSQSSTSSMNQKYYASPVAHVYLEPGLLSFIPSTPTPAQLISALLDGETPTLLWFSARRGFNWNLWKKNKNLGDKPSDDPQYVPEPVSQLVLVLHGIGQKMSERVEGFNFTYAVNMLQINMNKCIRDPNVQRHIPDRKGRILALPVNWRRRLNFDEFTEGHSNDSVRLKDIMMTSIPTVRKLVNEILLDIPYYMSRHKNLFLTAAVKEANRLYDLFISHNPKFQEYGTVHMLGHSLGSVMGADLLNFQNHRFKKNMDDAASQDSMNLDSSSTSTDSFSNNELRTHESFSRMDPEKMQLHFSTYNYFMAGSPLPLFLLMEGATVQSRDMYDESHPGHTGRYPFGCFEVRNIYNVMHHSDPVSCFLGPLISKHYCNLIKMPDLPTRKRLKPVSEPAPSLFDNLSKKLTFGKSKESSENEVQVEDEDGESLFNAVVELENRDFDKEYKGERNVYALNENGQVDWVIPLTASFDNQYISMLTAHSGYWDNTDFACMIVLECFRKRGKENTLDVYQAVRK